MTVATMAILIRAGLNEVVSRPRTRGAWQTRHTLSSWMYAVWHFRQAGVATVCIHHSYHQVTLVSTLRAFANCRFPSRQERGVPGEMVSATRSEPVRAHPYPPVAALEWR